MRHNQQRALALMGARPLPLTRVSGGPGLAGGARAYHAPGWFGKADHRKIAALRRFTKEHSLDPRLRWFVVQNILQPAGIQQREYLKQGAAICRWVQQNIYYTNEDGEQLQAPWVTLEQKTGDCDDMAVLAAALLQAIRLPWRFVLAGSFQGRRCRWVEPYREDGHRIPGYIQCAGMPPKRMDRTPRGFKPHHIYLQVGAPPFKPQAWRSFEPTVKGAPMGHDVVMHGMIKDSHLRGSGGGGMPELGAWGIGDYDTDDIIWARPQRPAEMTRGRMGLQNAGSRAVGFPAFATAPAYGAVGRQEIETSVDPKSGLPVVRVFEDFDWPAFIQGVAMSVATGVISAILIQAILTRKRRAGRRKRKR